MTGDVRVRFAPSPTGKLHVGGARTALFNWLFARRNGGKFLLRIEDTDRRRSSAENIAAIIDGLKYLNLDWDEAPVYQFARADSHREAANRLLQSGNAYRCFCEPEELARERNELMKKGIFQYPGHCRNLSTREIHANLSQGRDFAVRFKVEGEAVSYNDLAHGLIEVHCREIDDFIILRRDGTPTYQLSVVVDDIYMGITHVIRGDDHISNTPKQILLHRALEHEPPIYAHIPLILGADKKRLSKRHGAASLDEYRAEGILGKAMANYLALLGWSPGDDREMMSIDEIVEAFSFQGIYPKGAVFDPDKLKWMNDGYISAMDDEQLADRALRWYKEYGEEYLFESPDKQYLFRVIRQIKTRMRKLSDLVYIYYYYFIDPVEYDDKGVLKHFSREGLSSQLEQLARDFESMKDFSAEPLEKVIRGRAGEWGISTAKLIHPLRLAMTGVTGSPGIFELLEALGQECVTRRLERAIDFIARRL